MRFYNHFTLNEPENLWLKLEKKQSLRSINAELGRSPSTIHWSPEIIWKVDDVLGAVGRGDLVSAVDRKSRYLKP